MRKIKTSEPGKIEEIAIIAFFILFFLLTIVAESTAQVNGNSGHCLEYNGSTSGVGFSNSNVGLSNGKDMTVTAWVKCNSSSSSGPWAGVVSLNNSTGGGDDGQFWLQHSSNNGLFEFAVENTSSTRNYVQSTTSPIDGNWYHVAGVFDGNYIYLYVNGVIEAKTALSGKINNFQSTYKMVFGQWANSGDSYRRFDGDIDEVTLWNVALTQAQIRDYMCKKLTGTEAGLIGYWRMNETSGTSVNDVTSNARTGNSYNTNIVWSGAPIGDASTYTYGGTSLYITHPVNHDSLVVNNFSSTPSGVQMYLIDTIPNCVIPPSGYVTLVTTYYYGVFVCDNKGANFKMTYYYSGNPAVTSPSQTGIATRSDNSVLSWTDLNASLNLPKKYFQKGGQKNRAEYAIALNYNPLPITLINFAGTQSGNAVVLNWTTATEKNNDHFTIERTADGANYEAIATVQGAGNSTIELNYSTTDNNPLPGTAYYRLRQTDYDGNTKTYGPTAVNYTPQTGSSFEVQNLYPNLFTTGFKVRLACDNSVDLNMQLVNMGGVIVKQGTIHCAKGDNQYDFTNVSGLEKGLYVVVLYDPLSGHKVSERVIKQ